MWLEIGYMPKTGPFERHPLQYEEWFEKNKFAYLSELEALKKQMPKQGRGIEIGVGTGRFAVPLGIRMGIEPSAKMGELARSRGIKVIEGVAEALPLPDSSFGFALMVTTICFVDDIAASLREAYRILKPGGALIIGFVDRESRLGKAYQQRKDKSAFYREATFYSVGEVVAHLKKAGFGEFHFTQTLFSPLDKMQGVEQAEAGYGKGAFVVIRAVKGVRP